MIQQKKVTESSVPNANAGTVIQFIDSASGLMKLKDENGNVTVPTTTIVSDSLSNSSATEALSASRGKVLNDTKLTDNSTGWTMVGSVGSYPQWVEPSYVTEISSEMKFRLTPTSHLELKGYVTITSNGTPAMDLFYLTGSFIPSLYGNSYYPIICKKDGGGIDNASLIIESNGRVRTYHNSTIEAGYYTINLQISLS